MNATGALITAVENAPGLKVTLTDDEADTFSGFITKRENKKVVEDERVNAFAAITILGTDSSLTLSGQLCP